MSKLSEPVVKALQALLDNCKGDTAVVSRIITGNYSADNYTFHLINEIKLLRNVPYDSIVLALAQFIIAQSASKATEQPSKAAAVEGLEGILTEEELKERNRLLVLENDGQTAQIEKLKWICKRSSDFIDAMVGFTGQNLSVRNWHQNGDGEPFDNFVEENLEENLVTDLKTALEELK